MRERVGRGVASECSHAAPSELRLGSKLPSLRISPEMGEIFCSETNLGKPQETYRIALRSRSP
ncbi:hypothetical protein ERY430_40108 [Erythrobacter sp. EC-HK427]|nr:hypothetical protein ERY430_40108 [Erythrobacter sp. EC-HK427]